MSLSNQKKKKYLYFFIFLVGIIILSFQIIYLPNQKSYKPQKQNDLLLLNQQGLINQWFKETHINESWILNSDFNTETGWNSVFDGDVNDVSADIKNSEANFNVIGETYTTTLISGTPNSTNSPDWHNTTNPDIPVYPTQGHTINQFGCFASHLWAEHSGTTTNAYQKTSVQWEKVITTPINMSDYTVTNASLNVLINATAKSYIGCGSGDVWHWEGVEVSGDSGMDRFIEGDYVRFYVRLSNLDKNVNYKVAQYQNSTLGHDGAVPINGSYDSQYDKIFEADDIDDLIFYLNQVLENGDFQNFYIILGMEFNCEDNCATDLDEFSEVYIKACNFSISYVKKINQLTSVSWKYIGNQIDAKGGIVEILDSHLFFKYKINNTWPTTLSPNSEFRILINNREISETIKLSNAETSFKTAKEEGFDVAKLIPNDKDISVSIQVFLADNFDLEENYTISIDDVILKLSYDIFFPAQRDFTFLVLLIMALITSGILATYFVYYRRVLRFPPPVRKVRKYRKTLKKTNPPTITIKERNNAFNVKYKRALKSSSGVLGIKPLERYKPSNKKIIKKITKPKLSKELIFVLLILMGLFLIPIVYFVGISPLKINNDSKIITLSQEGSSNLFRRESFEEQWIKNSGFGIIDNWTSIIEGDTTDLSSSINGGNANYEILGDSGSQVFYENGSSSGWINVANDDNLPWPDVHQMTSDGWFASEDWPDNAPQSLQTQWRKNFSMNVNMSDYYITSASLEAWINATVQATPVNGGGIDRPGDILDGGTTVQIATGDFAKFFIMISDIDRNRQFEATHYQTDDLGKDGPPPITQLNDSIMIPINEETLIFYLQQALQYDYQNFSITLGIYIWCEDSGHPGDGDNWQSLLIKNFTLSISYEKKIDQFNSISWKYNGEKLEAGGYRIEITDARLNYEYKINQPWPTDLSPNSKFRIFINDIEHNETIRLNELSTIFQNIDEDGFDVTKLIPENDEINVSLQVYLADEFKLDNQLVISIDNVILWIHYNVLIPIEPNYLFQILFAVAVTGAVCLTSYIILYQRVLKYPKPVRKVRKYVRTLNKTQSPAISIEARESAFNKIYQDELKKTAKFLRGTPVDGKILRDKLLGDISKKPLDS